MRFLLSLSIGILIFVLLCSVVPVGDDFALYDDTLRLHVLAASDDAADQERKLKVRDAVLAYVGEHITGCETKENIVAFVGDHRDAIETVAKNVLLENGSDDCVSVEIGKESYPTRFYERFALPAGEYTSVRIVIGNGTGHNWWCVLFPPLCLAEATEPEEDVLPVGLTLDQYELITSQSEKKNGYTVKFRFLELLSEFFSS